MIGKAATAGIDIRDKKAVTDRLSQIDKELESWKGWETNPEKTSEIRERLGIQAIKPAVNNQTELAKGEAPKNLGKQSQSEPEVISPTVEKVKTNHPVYGQHELDVIEEYGGHYITRTNGGQIAVVSKDGSTVFFPALDDSTLNHKWLDEYNTVEASRDYLDWLNKARPELTKGDLKNTEIPGASERETFNLNNPTTDMSAHKPPSEQITPKNEDLFAQKSDEEQDKTTDQIRKAKNRLRAAKTADEKAKIEKEIRVLRQQVFIEPAEAGRKLIGKNSEGKSVREDDKGVRSILENGIRIQEPVQIIPTRGGVQASVDIDNRDERFKTKEETTPEKELEQMTGEERADQVMKSYNEQLAPNVFGDTRPVMKRGDKDWTKIKEEHEKEFAAAPDLTKKSTRELVDDMFSIINDHIGERGSISNKPIELDETLYQKLKPYLIEIVNRAKSKALDARAYLFGAVDSMPEGKAKGIYEEAARRYSDEQDNIQQEKAADKKETALTDAQKIERSKELGRLARENGTATAPAQDAEFLKLLDGLQVGEGIKFSKVWNEAFHAAAPKELNKKSKEAPTELTPDMFPEGTLIEVTGLVKGNRVKIKVPPAEALQDIEDNKKHIEELEKVKDCVKAP